MAKVKARDQQAATKVFHRFASRLVGLASTRLDLDLQPKVDPQDVVQSVFTSFSTLQSGRNGLCELGKSVVTLPENNPLPETLFALQRDICRKPLI